MSGPGLNRGRLKPKKVEQKCCPTCLRIMEPLGDRYSCPKHGAPTKP